MIEYRKADSLDESRVAHVRRYRPRSRPPDYKGKGLQLQFIVEDAGVFTSHGQLNISIFSLAAAAAAFSSEALN